MSTADRQALLSVTMVLLAVETTVLFDRLSFRPAAGLRDPLTPPPQPSVFASCLSATGAICEPGATEGERDG